MEEINGRKVFSLFEVGRSIQKTIAERYGSAYWIKAEMNKLNHYSHSGHCYPELVEKKDGKIIAQMRCNLWKDDYIKINATFQRVLNEPLKNGIKILFLGTISYHPEHGFSLRILDIDPHFTLGDLEREKQETIQRLRSEGLYGLNKTQHLSVLPQRLAIISVETSKGYADFLKILDGAQHVHGYRFFTMLFPAILQGERAVEAIARQLENIRRVIHHFDVVAIVRGGGGDIGLSCYNHYDLAKAIAQFPIPVITGIGHATNETVAEMISFENAITPSKLAEFLIQQFHNFAVPVHDAQEKIIDRATRLIAEEKSGLRSEVRLFQSASKNHLDNCNSEVQRASQALVHQLQFRLRDERSSVANLSWELTRHTGRFFNSERQQLTQFATGMKKDLRSNLKHASLLLENAEKNLSNLNPKNVLKRGYSITRLNGKSVRSSEEVKKGAVVDTILFEGSMQSIVQSTTKGEES